MHHRIVCLCFLMWAAVSAAAEKPWSFAPLDRSAPPAAGHPVDAFVDMRIKAAGLKPNPEVGRAAIIRRLSLDLRGLPPTPAELAAFLADQKPGAYERLVDRFLASTATAERLTLDWLDAARYADTNGYSIDDHRDMWAWRDWVIHAFTTNKPYDRFLTEQLAGDLLPGATNQQKLATGFLRNGMNTHEGGTITEEYRVAYTVDKVDTVATTFMGLTVKCAQCHEHKYDPINQTEYYRFYAFFNTGTEGGKGATNGNTAPMISVTSPLLAGDALQAAWRRRLNALEMHRTGMTPELRAEREAWEKTTLAQTAGAAKLKPLAKTVGVEIFDAPGAKWIWAPTTVDNQRVYLERRFDLTAKPSRALLAVSCDDKSTVWVNGKVVGTTTLWMTPGYFDVGAHLVKGANRITVQADNGSGAAGLLAVLAYDDKRLVTDRRWKHAFKPAGSNPGGGIAPRELPAKEIAPYGGGPWKKFKGKGGAKTPPASQIASVLRVPKGERTAAQWKQINDAFFKATGRGGKVTSVHAKTVGVEIGVINKQVKAGKTTAMIMDHKPGVRPTHVLVRGEYNKRGDKVTAGVPAALPPLRVDGDATRLDLAKWLVRDDHPLTARVAVNRYWQLLFGRGIVATPEDFGAQGLKPSHPKLLDWLAADFRENGWDVRRLLKTLVMSRAYRRSAAASQAALAADPTNLWLARSPRYRFSAEIVRDNALAIAGLLNPAVGGPSVYPPQPFGLWRQVSHYGYPRPFTAQAFFPGDRADRYRRGMYTVWKRTAPPPEMAIFDAPTRETCAVRRQSTNTPLQALVTLNGPVYTEAAVALARRMMAGGTAPAERVAFGWRAAVSREPSAAESALLVRAFERERAAFKDDAEAAEKLLARGGAQAGADAAEHAAWTMVASTILNLDETLTRP